MELPRQDPDQLLHAIRNDASTKKSGKLKIPCVISRGDFEKLRIDAGFRAFLGR